MWWIAVYSPGQPLAVCISAGCLDIANATLPRYGIVCTLYLRDNEEREDEERELGARWADDEQCAAPPQFGENFFNTVLFASIHDARRNPGSEWYIASLCVIHDRRRKADWDHRWRGV